MTECEWLAERFEAHRAHLRALAYQMLGSPSEADDAVQEAWLRLSRSDASGVENLGGWLTSLCATATSRVQGRGGQAAGAGVFGSAVNLSTVS